MTDQAPLHDDDIHVDTDLVRSLVGRQFPEWAGLPVERIRSSGTVNAIFRLGTDLVVRVPRAESYVWDLDLLGASHQWLRWAAPQLPVPIPEPVAIGEASDAYPWPWPIHRWVYGASLDTLNLRSSTTLARQLASFVRALHELPPADGPRSPKAIPRSAWDPQFRSLLPDLEGIIDTRRALTAWERTMEAPAWSGTFPWTHGDLLPGNLIASDGALAAVVDFECLGTGDPALDVAAAWALFDRGTRDVFFQELGIDEHTRVRAANLALRFVMGIRYYEHSNPRFSEMARSAVDEVINDLAETTASGVGAGVVARAAEEKLEGGWGREVRRRGDVVLRSPAPQSGTVIALLSHLRSEGCDFVPEPVGTGFASDGREQFRFIEGETTDGTRWSDDSLHVIGSMLRRAHDASARFVPQHPALWRDTFLRSLPGGRPVIGHGDLGPWNILVRDGQPMAFIDWDDAGPAGDQWDLANVVWLNAQLHDDDVAEMQGLPPLAERARRARLVLDGYELPVADRSGFVERMIEFAVHSARDEAVVCGITPTTPSPDDRGFPTLWAVTWRVRAAAWMYEHRAELERAIGH